MRLSVLILTLAGLAFFSAIVGGGLYYYSLKEVALKESGNNAASQAQIIKNRVSAFVQNNLNMVWLLSKHRSFRRYLETPDPYLRQSVDLRLDEAAGLMANSVFYLLNARGVTMASSNRNASTSFVGKDYSFRPYFKEAVKGRPAVYFALGVTSGKRGIYTGVPIYSGDGLRIIGVVVIKAPVDDLERELIADTVGTWILADENGIVFSSNRKHWLFQRLWPLAEDVMRQLENSQQFGNGPWKWIGLKPIQGNEVMDNSGRRYLISKVALEVAEGWVVHYLVDPETLFATTHNPLLAKAKYFVLMLSVMICTLTVVLYFHARMDIAQRKAMEKALRHSEEKYRLLIENADEAIVVLQDGRLTFFNQRTAELSGFSVEELASMSFVEMIHPDDQTDVVTRYMNRLRGEDVPSRSVFRIVDAQRTTRWLEASTVVIEWYSKPATLNFLTDITKRKTAEQSLQESETYLSTVMATIQTGVVVVDAASQKVVDANPCAAWMFEGRVSDLVGRQWGDLIPVDMPSMLNYKKDSLSSGGRICTLQTLSGRPVHVRYTSTDIKLRDRDCRIESFLEITDIVNLMQMQQVNIDLAKNILQLINGRLGRSVGVSNECRLFVDALSVPCYAEGGDHFFVRSLYDEARASHEPVRTVISLKDQSGHEVSCVLRSIVTDLVHHSLLGSNGLGQPGHTVSELNRTLMQSGLFEPDDFFTAAYAVIDHRTLQMQYVFAGHPPFLLVRGNTVRVLPKPGEAGTNPPMTLAENIPYSHGTVQLKHGDRLICFTDGLTEMPLKNKGRVLSLQALQAIAEAVVMQQPDIHVTDLMQSLLTRIADDAGEQVIARRKNTSADDVTLLGLEVESAQPDGEIAMRADLRPIPEQIESLYLMLAEKWRRNGFEAAPERLRIVLEEAVLNGWHHGNRQRPGSAVTVRWWFGNQFHLEVLDEGEGFDYRSLPNPVEYENLTASSGRGIYLMRYCSDRLEWKHGGRCLVAAFNRKKSEKTAHGALNTAAIDLWHPLPEAAAG